MTTDGHSVSPTAWRIYNLRQSPFFQRELESDPVSPRPLSLFVGRARELTTLLDVIHDAALDGSVQAVAGGVGVGKTTLVKELKSRAQAAGYLTTDAIVPVLQHDTADSLFARVLGALYDTILANRPQSGGHPAMADAQVLVRTTRLTSGGLNLSIPAVGGIGGSRGTTVVTPKDILIDGPRVMRDLMRMVVESDARGVVLHLNNLENLTDRDAARAADLFRTLRDVMPLHNGLHFVVVGTTDAVLTALGSKQVRHHAHVLPLEALDVEDVHHLLAARYEHLTADADQPARAPVDERTVEALYDLFRGDLRGLLRALEDGVRPLLGLVEPPRPLTIDDIRPLLRQRYVREMSEHLDARAVQHLTTWGSAAPAGEQTQKDLEQRWGIGQSAVSKVLKGLIEAGYVVVLPKGTGGTSATPYALSGRSRLIFG